MKEKSLISEDEKARLKALEQAETQLIEIQKVISSLENIIEKSIQYRRDISAGLFDDILPKDFND